MKFTTPEANKIFDKKIAEFIKKQDRETLKAFYKFSKEIRKDFGTREFSISHIYHAIILQELETIYKGVSLNKIAKLEGIPRRTIYNIFHKKHRSKKK
jgi:hypothetical protein